MGGTPDPASSRVASLPGMPPDRTRPTSLENLGESRDPLLPRPLGTVDRVAPLGDLAPRLGADLRTSPGVQLPAQVVPDLPGDVDDVREDVQRFDGPDVTLELVVMDHQEFVVGEEF